MNKRQTRCGFAAISCAPNAGKSTLLNALLGQKIAITSPKPQTTRSRILGVLTQGAAQACLIDTPGIFAPKGRLDRAMVGAAWQALDDADLVALVVDADKGFDGKTRRIIAQLRDRAIRPLLVLNKVDLVKKPQLLPLATELAEAVDATHTFMVAARNGDGVKDLRRALLDGMPAGPWLFDREAITDLPSSLFAAEITREQLYHQLGQELPYAAAVLPTGWEDRVDGSARISQQIVVQRDGQKPIVIGRAGARLKEIGAVARRELEKLLQRRVHLLLEVVVQPDWQEQRGYYQLFGLEDVTAREELSAAPARARRPSRARKSAQDTR